VLRAQAQGGGSTILASHDAAWLDHLGARIHPMTAITSPVSEGSGP
jgi:hypothetical protein